MKKSHIINIFILIGAIGLDQLTKRYGETLPTIHFNRGFILGFFAGQPPSIRIVTMAFSAAIIFTLYLVFLYLLPRRAKWLTFSLSLMMGGLFGNVIDKLMYAHTRDFIPFSLGNYHMVFNVADIMIWVGAAVIVWILIRHDDLIWYQETTRRQYLVNIPEQLSFSLQLTVIVFNACLLLSIFCFAFISSTFSVGFEGKVSVALALASITLFTCLFSFLAGIIMSHRRLGPLYAFDRFVNDLLEGKDRGLKLREKDNYKHLELTSEKLRKHFHKKTE